MHTLAAAQQVSVSVSSSLCFSSTASVFRYALSSSPQISVALSSTCKKSPIKTTLYSSLSATSWKIPLQDVEFLTRSNGVGRYTWIRLSGGIVAQVRLSKCICSASRKGGGESTGGEEEFEADISSLRTGFSKRFPGKDSSGLEYDWDLADSDDDGVELKSFKPGNYFRAQSPTSANSTGDNLSYRAGKGPDVSSRTGRFGKEERREAQGHGGRQGSGLEDFRNHRGTKGEANGPSYRSSSQSRSETSRNIKYGTNNGPGPGIERGNSHGASDGRGPRIERGDSHGARSSRSFEGRRGNDTPRPVRRGEEPHGGAEWSEDTPIFEDSEKKKKPVIEPVNFTSAMSESPHVAILGGGMSGLVCALTLEEHGIQSTVFDTGIHGLGGRMGTRYVEEYDGARLVFDHAAQFFTVADPRFQNLVDRWVSEGYVKKWAGSVGTLQAGGQYSELPFATRYIGTNGMRSLADSILSKSRLIDVRRPCWISRMDAMNGRWTLTENRKPQGEFDVVVIAHNGKCANRLLSTAHVPAVARQMKRLELSSIWALLAAFAEPLPLPGGKILDGAFVDRVDSLSWMGNNSSKLSFPDEKTPQCWTFFSTASYGRRNKVPQESIPKVKAQKVTHDMLRGVEAALGLSENSLPIPIYTRLQLWGAALPTNTPDIPCIFDANGRVGICGDWLIGASLEAAALSGMALGDHIAKFHYAGEQDGQDFNIGLKQTLTSLKSSDIGQFPGPEELPKQSPLGVLATA